MSKIIKITAFFLFFIMCFCLQNATAAVTDLTDRPLIQVETCTTTGATQTKYTYDGSCSYTSQTRECCGLSWSPWGGKCCSNSNKPITSRTCTTSAGYSGTQTRTVTCDNSDGTWDTGSWGTCVATAVCTPGDTRTGSSYCNGNKYHQQVCNSSGQWGTCECINQPDKYYSNMPYPVGAQVVNGVWSSEACYGMCCCEGSYGVLIKAVAGTYKGLMVPQCKSSSGTGQYTYACTCIYTTVDKEIGSGGLQLQPNL